MIKKQTKKRPTVHWEVSDDTRRIFRSVAILEGKTVDQMLYKLLTFYQENKENGSKNKS